MAQINKPTDYFNSVLYTGDGATSTAGTLARTISGVGFQSDFTWVKSRTAGGYGSHGLHDVVRTAPKWLGSDLTTAETDVTTFNSGGIGSFTSDGFGIYSGTTGATTNYNNSGTNYVAWNWLAGGTTASNTDGSITSTVSASTTSGFSIVSYTGGGSFGDTVGHGLGAVPAMIIIKTTNATSSWYIWQKNMGATDNQFMDFSTGALQTSGATIFDVSAMSSTTFTLGTNTDVNGSGSPKIAYCFAEKKGFSKFGSYTGNGSTDGTFVYTGFKPAFVIIKVSSTTNDWSMYDNQRDPINQVDNYLQPNTSSAEVSDTGKGTDFLSNGFKLRTTHGTHNTSGATYIYMAFASEPLVGSNNVPATAR